MTATVPHVQSRPHADTEYMHYLYDEDGDRAQTCSVFRSGHPLRSAR
jgi:hypothetical protein